MIRLLLPHQLEGPIHCRALVLPPCIRYQVCLKIYLELLVQPGERTYKLKAGSSLLHPRLLYAVLSVSTLPVHWHVAAYPVADTATGTAFVQAASGHLLLPTAGAASR
jgi:hypothetical protein